MVKKEFKIKSGHHSSNGNKIQGFYYSVFFFVISLILFSINAIPFWVSLLTLVFAFLIQTISSLLLFKTRNEVIFDDSCLYDMGDDPDRFDINKLFGIGFLNHHKNSARFGWRANGELIEIFTYVYNNGERVYKKLITAKPNQKLDMQINFSPKEKVIDFLVQLPDGERAKQTYEFGHIGFSCLFIYKLFPYFGGNKRAPHDMKIVIEEIS